MPYSDPLPMPNDIAAWLNERHLSIRRAKGRYTYAGLNDSHYFIDFYGQPLVDVVLFQPFF